MPGADPADVAGPDQQPVARHLGVRRVLAKGSQEQGRHAHGHGGVLRDRAGRVRPRARNGAVGRISAPGSVSPGSYASPRSGGRCSGVPEVVSATDRPLQASAPSRISAALGASRSGIRSGPAGRAQGDPDQRPLQGQPRDRPREEGRPPRGRPGAAASASPAATVIWTFAGNTPTRSAAEPQPATDRVRGSQQPGGADELGDARRVHELTPRGAGHAARSARTPADARGG